MGNYILENEIEITPAGCRQGCCSLGFEAALIMIFDAYGGTVKDVTPANACGGVCSLVVDGDGWTLGDNLLSNNADLCASLRVGSKAMQKRCCQLNLAIP